MVVVVVVVVVVVGNVAKGSQSHSGELNVIVFVIVLLSFYYRKW